jgi:hypothetical protein
MFVLHNLAITFCICQSHISNKTLTSTTEETESRWWFHMKLLNCVVIWSNMAPTHLYCQLLFWNSPVICQYTVTATILTSNWLYTHYCIKVHQTLSKVINWLCWGDRWWQEDRYIVAVMWSIGNLMILNQ